MKSNLSRLIAATKFAVLLFPFLALASCGKVSSDLPAAGTATGTGTAATVSKSITVTASPATASTYGMTTITATVLDGSGKAVADGTSVTFTSDSTIATLSSSSATTTGGIAKVTLTAKGTAGTVTVTAASGSLTGSVSISITAATASAITLSSSPSSISIGGASTVTARVVDASGNPVVDGTLVSFTLDKPSLGSLSGSQAVTSSGSATVTLTASTTTGTVTVTATSGTLTTSIAVTITATTVGKVTIAASPSTITVLGTSTVTATVADSNGKSVQNGTSVSFTLDNSAYGTLSSTSATTYNGAATTTFTASSTSGSVIITGTSGSVSSTATVIIDPSTAASIAFASATPQVVGIKGSGQTETALIKFLVKDANGNPVTDGVKVSFSMKGPGGGEYLSPETGSTVSGYASTTLQSGTVAGPVTVNASVTVGTQTLSSSATQISIGGGAASAKHFDIASSKLNLSGLASSNKQATITVYLADRFGNYNVLAGTSVSFYAEAGAVDRSGVTDKTGIASVTYRTQSPNPANVAISPEEKTGIDHLNSLYSLTGSNTTLSAGIDSTATTINVASTTGFKSSGWIRINNEVISYTGGTATSFTGCTRGVFSTTPADHSNAAAVYELTSLDIKTDGTDGHPRDGISTILATVMGEEAFDDTNGNGLYDKGEPFTDLGEPFIDKNGDGCRNDGSAKNCSGTASSSTDPFEEFIDSNGNKKYDGPNSVWDGPGCSETGCEKSKMIWMSINIGYTGNSRYCAISPTSFNVSNGGSQNFSFMVGDMNTNKLVSGTTIAVAATAGTLSGTTSYTVPDGVPNGPTIISFILADSDSATDKVAASTVTVTVSSTDVVGCTATSSGTVR